MQCQEILAIVYQYLLVQGFPSVDKSWHFRVGSSPHRTDAVLRIAVELK